MVTRVHQLGRCLVLMSAVFASACDDPPKDCPAGMVRITGGEVKIGEERPAREWHEPMRTVQMADYCMDVYEYPNQAGQLPKGNVSWQEAEQLCVAAGKRLCSSDEWERACRGVGRWRYSYGPNHNAKACNTPIDGPGPGNNPAPVAASGAYADCHTPEGVFDLNGNLSEWVSDSWTGDPEPFNRRAVVTAEDWRVIRGGTMWNRTFYGQDCTSRHGHHKVAFANMDDGFRCCATP